MEVLTLKEAAKLLKLSPFTLYRYAKQGKVPGVRIGKHWRFVREQLERQLLGQTETPTEPKS